MSRVLLILCLVQCLLFQWCNCLQVLMSLHKIPKTASVAVPGADGRLSAPSALKNSKPIIDLVLEVAPDAGQGLEIASGTGEHMVKLASALPGITFQPTDIDESRIASIDAWCNEGSNNIKEAVLLDAAKVGWSANHPNQNFILLVNLIHLISETEAATVVQEISSALLPGGRALIYGPFKRDGELTSDGDKNFHQSLQEADPAIGYKDDTWMAEQFKASGVAVLRVEQMPANNLAFVVEKPI